ncbi:MAG: Na+/H+ antiporter NhaA [Alphaproteobacteria bacterium]|nr:Na+/H+ antiporter NhaA [Alphaproteobacteria bacterium]
MKRTGANSALREFLTSEAAGGVLLIVAAALAMIVANVSPDVYHLYHDLLHDQIGPVLSDKLGPMTAHLWINDGLMAIFFLLVGLEIKREFVDGRLSTWERRRLPVIAAAVGMLVPACIFLFVARGHSGLENGWAIPAATDIAFAIGVLALLGSRAPTSLKLFLTTVAIVDDMGAVAIIAIAYTGGIKSIALLVAVLILGLMYFLNKTGVKSLAVYILCFAALWYAVLLSGVHATVAGVLAAMMIPIRKTPGAPDSPLHILEHRLHPWSAYLIVPLFGFANAGVRLEGMGMEQLLTPLPLGIAAGLFLGKQLGIFGSIWLCVKFGLASQLRGATWLQIYGVALLCGIGFTMSLFIGALAFPHDPALVEEAKIGVLTGSILSALVGFTVLRLAPLHPRHRQIERNEDAKITIGGNMSSMEKQLA